MNSKTGICLTVVIAFFIIACNTVSEPNDSRPDYIIDSHIHYVGTNEWEKSFIEVFTHHKAMGCVLVRMADLERGIEFARKNPHLVIPYAAIDIESPTVTDDIRKSKDMGFNIIRFNKMLDANNVPEETRINMYGRTIARIHGLDSVHGFPVN